MVIVTLARPDPDPRPGPFGSLLTGSNPVLHAAVCPPGGQSVRRKAGAASLWASPGFLPDYPRAFPRTPTPGPVCIRQRKRRGRVLASDRQPGCRGNSEPTALCLLLSPRPRPLGDAPGPGQLIGRSLLDQSANVSKTRGRAKGTKPSFQNPVLQMKNPHFKSTETVEGNK